MRNHWPVVMLFVFALTRTAVGQETAVPPLPEGDSGIAAKYPGDVGIERDPAVVFYDGLEGFEDDTVVASPKPQKGNKWDYVIHTVRITREPEAVHSGKNALEVRHEEPMSYGVDKHFAPGLDTVYVRYYLKYHKEFPGCHHNGVVSWALAPGQIKSSGAPNSATGVRPNGHNHFVTALDATAPWMGFAPGPNRAPGTLTIYCYHMDQGSRRWGDLFFPSGAVVPSENTAILGKAFVKRPDCIPELGRWYCYELMLKANAPGERNGRVAFWVDGRLAGDFTNLRFRDVETLKVNILTVGSYSSSKHPNTVMWYDDIVVGTSYIGPMVREKAALAKP